MMYPYMTLEDETEVTHSPIDASGHVEVYFEKAVYGGFHDATCILPEYKWKSVHGFNQDDIDGFTEYLKHNAHIILELAAEGGFEHATAV